MKHILNDSKNVLLPVSWLHDGAGQSDTFLIDTLLLCLQELHRSHDIRLGVRVCQGISRPMLSEDPSRREEYVEIKAAIENAENFHRSSPCCDNHWIGLGSQRCALLSMYIGSQLFSEK